MSTPVLDMILRSGLMGRIIISMLMILSLITWAIIFNRFFVLSRVRAGNGLFRRMYESLKRVSDIENMDKKVLESPMAQMGRAGASEYRRILEDARSQDRKSTRLNSSHVRISYAVFCLKKKTNKKKHTHIS